MICIVFSSYFSMKCLKANRSGAILFAYVPQKDARTSISMFITMFIIISFPHYNHIFLRFFRIMIKGKQESLIAQSNREKSYVPLSTTIH